MRAEADIGREVLTDIDVLSIDVDLRLRTSKSILECKSAPGQAGEPDRLLWLAGLRTFLGVDRAVLVRTTASRRGLALARRLGVHLIDEQTLQTREAAHAWLPKTFAHMDGELCLMAEKRADTQLRAFGELAPSLVSFLRGDALLAESHVILGALVALENAIQNVSTLPNPAGWALASHALIGLVLCGISDAGRAETIPNVDLKRRLERALTAGSPDDDHVLDVLGQVDELVGHEIEQVHRAYVEAGAERLLLPMQSLRQLVGEPPPWLDRYLDFVERLRANPSTSRDLLQSLELGCFDALVGGTGWRAPSFDHLFTPEHRNLALVAQKLLSDIIGPSLAEHVAPLADLPFDRVRPPIPDRRTPNEREAPEQGPAQLAIDTDRGASRDSDPDT